MPSPPNINDQLTTLFALGREVTSVLDLDELLQRIPELIARLTKFQAFAVYLLDPKRNELTIAYSVGYPEEVARTLRVNVGVGLVGAAVAEGQPLLVNDVHKDPRYFEAVPGSNAELVVPLRRKGRVIGALNLLSDTVGQFTDVDERVHRHARDARRDRAGIRRHPQPRRAAHAHRQARAPRHRLPHVRHPAGQRRDR
jgi:putative methionine-R-sulfoxide reductase with GAF domain